MKPVLYRYKNSESVIPVMDGYTPGEGWVPLYDESEVKAATNAALERAAEEVSRIDDETWFRIDDETWFQNQSAFGIACRKAIRALKESKE